MTNLTPVDQLKPCPQVSEAMIEAGICALQDCPAWAGANIPAAVMEIYLAMQSARTTDQGPSEADVKRVTIAVMRCVRPHLKRDIAVSNLDEAIRTAMQSTTAQPKSEEG
jgi:hypothetical protein